MIAVNGATSLKMAGSPFRVLPTTKKWNILIGLEKVNDIPIIRITDHYHKSTKEVMHYVARSRDEFLAGKFHRPSKDSDLIIYAKPYVIGNVLRYANNGTVAIAEAIDENGKTFTIATDCEFLDRTSDEYNICWYRYDPA